MPELDPADARWHLVQQVVQSPQFEKSPRLRSFLLFVCEMELTGQSKKINEQEIGVKVFGRPEGYNPGDDSIVRSQARILRQRLSEYFAGPGAGTALRITIPRGTYVPVFEAVKGPDSSPVPELSPRQDGSIAVQKHRRAFWAGASIAVVLILAALAWGIYRMQRPKQRMDVETSFWSSVLGTRRTAVIVPSDSTLVLIEELMGQPVSFEEYLNRRYLENPALNKGGSNLTARDLNESHYTSMADLNLAVRLTHLPQAANAHPEIRYARDLSISDAREGNLILIGGERANPWVQLFARGMNFIVDYDWQRKENMVVNRSPRQGEAALYLQDPNDPQHRVYGLVAYEPSLDGEGNSLLVAGTSSAGTQAAADFLLSNHLFGDFLRQMQRPDGSIPHFELLLVAHDLNGSVAGSTILASRLAR